MRAYIMRRLLLVIPTLLLVTIFVFTVARLVPGNVIDLMLAEQEPSNVEVTRADLLHKLGMDVPVHVQYVRWLGDAVLHADLGESVWTNRKVVDEIALRVPVSFELGLMALIISLTLGLTIGTYSAIRQDTLPDYIGRSVAIFSLSVPSFWIGTLVIVFPAIWWHWSPPLEYKSIFVDPWSNLRMFIIPALIMGMAMSGGVMRMTRTMTLEVLRQDYIRTGWAKGLRERVVIFRHAMKNALIPVVTVVGQQLTIMLSGSVIMETLFGLPGMGRLMVTALNKRDYTVISGMNLVVAMFIMSMILIIDLMYSVLDPRIRYR